MNNLPEKSIEKKEEELTMKLLSDEVRLEADEWTEDLSGGEFDSEESQCEEELSTTDSSETSSPSKVEIEGLELLFGQTHISDSDSDTSVSFGVDSLVLARARLPHIRHCPRGRGECPRRLLNEVDSLVLAKRRLPHLIHKRRINFKRRKDDKRYVSSHLKKSSTDEDDTSTTSNESTFTFNCATVDSLILTRRRLALKRQANQRRGTKNVPKETGKEQREIKNIPKENKKEHEETKDVPKKPIKGPENFLTIQTKTWTDLKVGNKGHHIFWSNSFHELVKDSTPNRRGTTSAA